MIVLGDIPEEGSEGRVEPGEAEVEVELRHRMRRPSNARRLRALLATESGRETLRRVRRSEAAGGSTVARMLDEMVREARNAEEEQEEQEEEEVEAVLSMMEVIRCEYIKCGTCSTLIFQFVRS